MTQKEIRVGIVGANAKASWVKVSHVPAINGLPGLKLAAVATRNEQSLRETSDHVCVLGKTRSGAVFTAEISGGAARRMLASDSRSGDQRDGSA